MRPKIRNITMIQTMVEEWNDNPLLDMPLHEYLGWTWNEYVTWLEIGEAPE